MIARMSRYGKWNLAAVIYLAAAAAVVDVVGGWRELATVAFGTAIAAVALIRYLRGCRRREYATFPDAATFARLQLERQAQAPALAEEQEAA